MTESIFGHLYIFNCFWNLIFNQNIGGADAGQWIQQVWGQDMTRLWHFFSLFHFSTLFTSSRFPHNSTFNPHDSTHSLHNPSCIKKVEKMRRALQTLIRSFALKLPSNASSKIARCFSTKSCNPQTVQHSPTPPGAASPSTNLCVALIGARWVNSHFFIAFRTESHNFQNCQFV